MIWFALKKAIGSLLLPLPLATLLMAIGLWRLRRAPTGPAGWRWLIAGLSLLWLASLPLASGLAVRWLEHGQRPFDPALPAPDAIVVLGSGYRPYEGRPLTSVLDSVAVVRLAEAVRLARRWPQVPLHCTGWGADMPGSSAEAACALAVELGVAPTRIVIHPEPRDTAEEAAAVAAALPPGATVLIVTHASHMPRAMRWFAAQGLKTASAATGFLDSGRLNPWPLPSATALATTSLVVHEMLGGWVSLLSPWWRRGTQPDLPAASTGALAPPQRAVSQAPPPSGLTLVPARPWEPGATR